MLKDNSIHSVSIQYGIFRKSWKILLKIVAVAI